jgi:hypothetical protein
MVDHYGRPNTGMFKKKQKKDTAREKKIPETRISVRTNSTRKKNQEGRTNGHSKRVNHTEVLLHH